MLDQISIKLQELLNSIKNSANISELDNIKTIALGKSGFITNLFKQMNNSDDNKDKHIILSALNDAKQKITNSLIAKKQSIEKFLLDQKLKSENIDITLPVKNNTVGSRHILSSTISRINQYYRSRGFDVVDGPEIDSEFYNFDALNIKSTHPARQSCDTFYVTNGLLLRTQTSTMQIRHLLKKQLPINMVGIGKVFRSDDFDATHSPVFTQMECLVANRYPISICHLKQELIDFLSFIFDTDDLDVRFRVSYFPFVEPGMEVDCFFNGSWLEIGGAGIVHPNVFSNCGIDGRVYGFAFGIGIERIIMIKNKINDIRYLYDGDIRVLRQLNI